MLVKLGNVWVNPHRVSFLEIFGDDVTIITTEGSTRTSGDIDEFASIVNSAGQSFGGEDEEPKEV